MFRASQATVDHGEDGRADTSTDLGRLRWQCRRGMLELDLLLTDFVDRGYARLPSAEQADFARLLQFQDHVLHDWLIGGGSPEEPALRAMVARIMQERPSGV